MKLLELLKRFDLWLRPAYVHGEHGDVRVIEDGEPVTAVSGDHAAEAGLPWNAVPPPIPQDWGGNPH